VEKICFLIFHQDRGNCECQMSWLTQCWCALSYQKNHPLWIYYARTDNEPIICKFWNVYISTMAKQGNMSSQTNEFCHSNASCGFGDVCVQMGSCTTSLLCSQLFIEHIKSMYI